MQGPCPRGLPFPPGCTSAVQRPGPCPAPVVPLFLCSSCPERLRIRGSSLGEQPHASALRLTARVGLRRHPATVKRFSWSRTDRELQRTAPLCAAQVCPALHFDHKFHMVPLYLGQLHDHARFLPRRRRVPFDRHADRGNCPSADTHLIFNQSLVAETPKFSNHIEDMLLGHWRFSFSAIVQSGTDISPILILDFSGSGNGLPQRPDLIGDPYCHPRGRNCWLNPASFAPPPAYSFGNLKNNSLFGPGSILVNTGCPGFSRSAKAASG